MASLVARGTGDVGRLDAIEIDTDGRSSDPQMEATGPSASSTRVKSSAGFFDRFLPEFRTNRRVVIIDRRVQAVHLFFIVLVAIWVFIDAICFWKIVEFVDPTAVVNVWTVSSQNTEPDTYYCNNPAFDFHPIPWNGSHGMIVTNASCKKFWNTETFRIFASSLEILTMVRNVIVHPSCEPELDSQGLNHNLTVAGTNQPCVWTEFNLGVEDEPFFMIHAVSTEFLPSVSNAPSTFNGREIEWTPGTKGRDIKFTLRSIFDSMDKSIDDVNVGQAFGHEEGKPPRYRHTGTTLVWKLKYSNFRTWDFWDWDVVKCEQSTSLQEQVWGADVGKPRSQPITLETGEVVDYYSWNTGVRINFVTEGQLGRVWISQVMSVIVNGVVLFGTAAALTKLIAKHTFLRNTYDQFVVHNYEEVQKANNWFN